MTHGKWHRLGVAVLAAAITFGTMGTAQATGQWTPLDNVKALSQLHQTKGKMITLGWTSWSDAKFMIALVKQQIESHTSLSVHAQKLRIGVQYRAVAQGDIDGMVMAWLPDTHREYWKKVHAKVVDLGPMYRGAVVGWAVPDYVPESQIDSIADLKNPQIAKQLGGKIVGIDSGAGEMRESRTAMKDYGLKGQYRLVSGTDQSMTRALKQAISDRQPIVVTLWTPHWAWAKWKLRFLKDPQHEFGGPQHVDVIVRKGFAEDYPKTAKFLANLHVPLAKLQHAMYVAYQTDEETAVAKFVKNNQALVQSWWAHTNTPANDADQ